MEGSQPPFLKETKPSGLRWCQKCTALQLTGVPWTKVLWEYTVTLPFPPTSWNRDENLLAEMELSTV